MLRRHFDAGYGRDEGLPRINALAAEVAGGLVREDRVREWARWALVSVDRAPVSPAGFVTEKYSGLAAIEAHQLASRLADRLAKVFGIRLNDDERLFLTLPIAGLGTGGTGEGDSELAELVEGMIEAVHTEMAIDLGGSDYRSDQSQCSRS